MSRVTFTFTGTSDLSTDEVWPDGDAPDPVFPGDVYRVLHGMGIMDLLRDWDLRDDMTCEVRLDGVLITTLPGARMYEVQK